jgi:tRNA nucleotidyltransferase (CCA-adding enzyme)
VRVYGVRLFIFNSTCPCVALHLLTQSLYIFKGGSLGKGTAVRGRSDVDLLVVMNDFKNVDQLEQNMERILRDFSDYLSSTVESATHGQVEKRPTLKDI